MGTVLVMDIRAPSTTGQAQESNQRTRDVWPSHSTLYASWVLGARPASTMAEMKPAPLPPDVSGALRAYAECLRSRFGARLRWARLFGSFARGEAHDRSDVDVAAVVEDLTREEWREAVGDAHDIELDSEVPLSPFVVSGAHFDHLVVRERLIARNILSQGVPL